MLRIRYENIKRRFIILIGGLNLPSPPVADPGLNFLGGGAPKKITSEPYNLIQYALLYSN